ncbi:MAG: sigma-70 family RNA polymerase sigma factor [Acetobacteraceae bacterium]|nr:sigma-70 family RNA polymerase sigma factor [Pseudomonadota bacterium]
MTDLAAEIEPHIPALRRYAWALVRNQDAADDLVQDCLERAISRWHLRRPDADPRALLFTILRNQYVNTLRQKARRGPHVDIQDAEAHIASDPDGERSLLGRDALQALSTLPEEQRSLLLLIAVEGLSYQQAAEVFGVPIGTIMSRLSRARASLRALIEGGTRVTLRRVK